MKRKARSAGKCGAKQLYLQGIPTAVEVDTIPQHGG